MNRSQLETFLRQHHREAFLWARQCCGFDGELAKDVIQQVYLKVLEGKAKLKSEDHPKTWLFSVIRFTAMDELRAKGKWLTVEIEEDMAWESEPHRNPKPRRPDSPTYQDAAGSLADGLLPRHDTRRSR